MFKSARCIDRGAVIPLGRAVAARGQDGGVRAEAVDGAVVHVERGDAAAHAVLLQGQRAKAERGVLKRAPCVHSCCVAGNAQL